MQSGEISRRQSRRGKRREERDVQNRSRKRRIDSTESKWTENPTTTRNCPHKWNWKPKKEKRKWQFLPRFLLFLPLITSFEPFRSFSSAALSFSVLRLLPLLPLLRNAPKRRERAVDLLPDYEPLETLTFHVALSDNFGIIIGSIRFLIPPHSWRVYENEPSLSRCYFLQAALFRWKISLKSDEAHTFQLKRRHIHRISTGELVICVRHVVNEIIWRQTMRRRVRKRWLMYSALTTKDI